MARFASSSGRTRSIPSIPTVSTPLLTGDEWVILDLFRDSASSLMRPSILMISLILEFFPLEDRRGGTALLTGFAGFLLLLFRTFRLPALLLGPLRVPS